MPSQEYLDFFLNSSGDIIKYVTFQIYHPDFDPPNFFFVQNNANGLVVELETSVNAIHTFCPVRITPNETLDDLDFGIRFEFGDVGEILPEQFDKVQEAGGFSIKPILKYREYRSDDLTQPMSGPLVLEIKEITFNQTGAVFEARARSLNLSVTGEFYTLDRFPMLKGLL